MTDRTSASVGLHARVIRPSWAAWRAGRRGRFGAALGALGLVLPGLVLQVFRSPLNAPIAAGFIPVASAVAFLVLRSQINRTVVELLPGAVAITTHSRQRRVFVLGPDVGAVEWSHAMNMSSMSPWLVVFDRQSLQRRTLVSELFTPAELDEVKAHLGHVEGWTVGDGNPIPQRLVAAFSWWQRNPVAAGALLGLGLVGAVVFGVVGIGLYVAMT